MPGRSWSQSGRLLGRRWQAFDLSAQEWQVLSAYLARLRREKPKEGPEAEPAGAGEGGVILALGRDVPRGRVMV